MNNSQWRFGSVKYKIAYILLTVIFVGKLLKCSILLFVGFADLKIDCLHPSMYKADCDQPRVGQPTWNMKWVQDWSYVLL